MSKKKALFVASAELQCFYKFSKFIKLVQALFSCRQILLGANFTTEDVKRSLFSVRKGKAPGPNGLPGRFLKKFNLTLITLIPKVPNPVEIKHFRPIALCNTIAKLVAKVLAGRLKKILATIVSKSQSAFIPNRLITDNTSFH
ncbi:hypothetical protein LIER_14603 [Lithospermum erythrorhizon]|uniref:Reverse transcriptase domain-containing protein n=1 Tax=Lithospermum erythrorhizon TaxID=34254 RepID=A0AAV3Q1C5_LITER